MRRKLLAVAVLATGALTLAARTPAADWNVDQAHSAVSFTTRHFFTPVRGQFAEFSIQLAYDPAHPENSTVRATIPVAGVNTDNARRDTHLKSPDFFDALGHPSITFVSEQVTRVSDTELLVRGPLTIRGRTRQVELPVHILGVMDVPADMRPMMGGVQHIASFQTQLTLDRRDFGVGVGNWAATMVVGSDVEITISVEANR